MANKDSKTAFQEFLRANGISLHDADEFLRDMKDNTEARRSEWRSRMEDRWGVAAKNKEEGVTAFLLAIDKKWYETDPNSWNEDTLKACEQIFSSIFDILEETVIHPKNINIQISKINSEIENFLERELHKNVKDIFHDLF